MSFFAYDTTHISVRTDQGSTAFDPLRCDAVKCYMGHYQNFLFLDFMSKNGTMQERDQANREIEICNRKMKYWERQPHFSHEEMLRQKSKMHSTNKYQ